MTQYVTILVTGGSGLVGKGIELALNDAQYNLKNVNEQWIFASSKDVNLKCLYSTEEYFTKINPTVIIHLAAKVGGLFNNMSNNLQFFRENMAINDNVLSCAHKLGVKKVISCLSTCIFPDKTPYPIDESMIHNGPPHNSNYGYSYAKRMITVLNRGFNMDHRVQYTSVIPTNVYGPFDNFNIEDGHVLPGLIHKTFLAKRNKTPLTIWGTGSPLRQFIYSVDLGRLLIWATRSYSDTEPIILSVDESDEVSIKAVANLVSDAMQFQGDIVVNDVIYNLMLDSNFTSAPNGSALEPYCSMEWSPLDAVSNKSYLGLMRFDGRIILVGQNNTNNEWQKDIDVTDIYHRHYRDMLLESPEIDGVVQCKEAAEYITLKNDLKLIDFSFSMVLRENQSQQYFLMATMSCTGIISIFGIFNGHMGYKCKVIFSERLDLKDTEPLHVKLCDISESSILLTVIDNKNKITSFPYSLISGEHLTVKTMSQPFVIHERITFSKVSQIYWCMRLSQLIVGFKRNLLLAKVTCKRNNIFEAESRMIDLPSSSEISGLYLKNDVVYISDSDGYIFSLTLNTCLSSVELKSIKYHKQHANNNQRFLNVFVSPNGVFLGLLRINLAQGIRWPTIVMISISSESEMLNILMDDNVPFNMKQDVVEELRHLYANMVCGPLDNLKKIADADTDWDNSLHKLQFVRYVSMFLGYKLNIDHELSESMSSTKMRNLESIIIIKNISYWLDGFCEMSDDEISEDDCIFVLKVTRRLKLVPDNRIDETIESAESLATEVLRTTFGVKRMKIERYKNVAEDVSCPTCAEKCPFNIFSIKCPNGHLDNIARCCKSLSVCVVNSRFCNICDAAEDSGALQGSSTWRTEIANSNCPLCDGKFLNVR